MEALQPRMVLEKTYELHNTNLGDTLMKMPVSNLLASKHDKNHSFVHKALKSLTKKDITVSIYNEKGLETYINILMEREFHFQDNHVELKLSRNLVPEFLALAKNHTLQRES